jgi:type IV pilus assembly protein PilW
MKAAAQRGLTLVELMVAMAIGLLVTIVAVGALVMGRTGFSAVENTSQLLDNERLAVDLITRLVVQAGYQDLAAPMLATRAVAAALGQDPEPDIFGWNNAAYTQPTSLAMTTATEIQDGDRPGKCSGAPDTSCVNGSDVLVVRFQGSNAADESMTSCMGTAQPGLTAGSLDERALNLLFVDRDAAGEPALYCALYDHTAASWSTRQIVVPGVESMQLLFGVDNVTANTVPAAGGQDTIVDRWLRADQIKVAGNAVATRENWRRVRAVRVGLLLRGPVGSAIQRATATHNTIGPSFVSADDVGSALQVAADGRVRRVASFTVHVRNDLSTRP